MTGRPVLLDAFCGAGGAAVGYHRAGFDVVGVDTCPQPRYPFKFVLGDAVEYIADHGRSFDAIHASPPCQRFGGGASGYQWPDLVKPTHAALLALASGDGFVPWVIENVPAALLPFPTRLCGTQFPGLRVIRHRDFHPGGFAIPSLPHGSHPPVYAARRGRDGQDPATAFVQITGGGNCSLANASDAMGIDWMHKTELNEALPPAYTEYVGRYLLAAVQGAT